MHPSSGHLVAFDGMELMLLKNHADYRSLVWVSMAMLLVAAQYCNPAWVIYLSPISCYVAIACGTIAHNHNHRATFSNRRINSGFGHLLSIFYGYPTLMWVPTHNLNHHHFVNGDGDATATWRFTNRHTLWVVLMYPFMSAYFQSFPIKDYVQRVKLRKPRLYSSIRFQYMFLLTSYASLGILAAVLYHKQQTGLGLYLWFFSVILPAICSSTIIMFFNYIQHVHTDSRSEHDHSRNFTGKWFNFLFFNNGYHTTHHENPGMHWSQLPASHAKVVDSVNPVLNEPNLVWFMLRQYLLAPILPRLGTTQLGAAPGPDKSPSVPPPSVIPPPKCLPLAAGHPKTPSSRETLTASGTVDR